MIKKEILSWSAGHIGGIEYLLDSIRRKVKFHCSESGMLPKRFLELGVYYSCSWILVPAQVDLPSDLNMLVWEVVGRFKYSQLTLPIRRA
jgi:hypothetical protein